MSRAWPYGKAVVDGAPQYFSPSALTLADSSGNDGCLRAWWFQYVEGKKSPQSKAQDIGVQLHAEIEDYLRTGVNALGPLALRGKFMIPEPGPDLMIEHDIVGGQLVTAPVRVKNVPVAGYIDLIHARGTNKGASDIEDTVDPPNTVEVIDWKSTSKEMYIKSPTEMARTIQMTVYAKWALTQFPQTSGVRLSHGYFVTKGSASPRKVTLRMLPEQIERNWKYVEGVASSVIDAARETTQDSVEANTRACGRFGGCTHKPYCLAAQHDSLADLFDFSTLDLGNTTMVTTEPSPEVRAEMNRLVKEEARAQAPELAQIVADIEAAGLGFPTLTKEAAKAVAAIRGSAPISAGAGLAGCGELSQYTIDKPELLPQLLEEVRVIVAERAKTPAVPSIGLLPPDVPEATTPVAPVAEIVPKKSAGRPKKAAPTTTTVTTTAPAEIAYVAVAPTTTTTAINLYVDCIPSCDATDFWPTVTHVMSRMNERSGLRDFRMADGGEFGYGKWRGILAACLRECSIPAGHYVFDSSQSEVAQVVVETMRDIVVRSGGNFVRGVR